MFFFVVVLVLDVGAGVGLADVVCMVVSHIVF